MSSKRRQQTRRLKLDQEWLRWPENHNERVAISKQFRSVRRAALQATRGLARLRVAFIKFTAASNTRYYS